MISVAAINQLDVDAHPFSITLHAAFEQVAHPS